MSPASTTTYTVTVTDGTTGCSQERQRHGDGEPAADGECELGDDLRGRFGDADGDDRREQSELSMESGQGDDGVDHGVAGLDDDLHGDGDGRHDGLRQQRQRHGDGEPGAGADDGHDEQAACAGSEVSWSVAASGAGLTYQWQRDGTNLVEGVDNFTGTTTATLTNSAVAAADSLDATNGYACVISIGTCSVTSTLASLTVNPLPTVSVNSATICAGDSAMLTATTGASSPSYQWKSGRCDDGVHYGVAGLRR